MTTTSNFFDLAVETNTSFVHAFSEAVRRNVAFSQNVWSIVGAPYTGDDISSNLGDGFERLQKISDLALAEVEKSNTAMVSLMENVLTTAVKARDESTVAVRSLAKNGLDGMKTAAGNTEERLADLAKNFETVKA